MEFEKRLSGERYLLREQLGEGGNGAVYLCYDTKLQKEWAVKELPETGFERSMELELLKSVSCSSFPRIVDIVKEDNCIFLIMDYVKGITLKERMRRKSVTEGEVLSWAPEIAKGIRYLHQMTPPILYMDCKPDNIMLTEDGEIRLIDLGSAYVCRDKREQRISGTGFFAPAEQRKIRKSDELPDARSDIYAFGMTLYYLLVGEKKEWRKNGRLCIREKNPAVSWGMSHIIEKCTMEDPKQRYQSMDEVIDQLRHIRQVGKWKAGKVCTGKVLILLGKFLGGVLGLTAAWFYQMTGLKIYFFLMILGIGILFRYILRRKNDLYETKMDVFYGNGKKILYIIAGMIGLMTVLHTNLYAKSEQLEVILFDSTGRKILVRNGGMWEISEDIQMLIPADVIDDEGGRITISYVKENGEEMQQYSFLCKRL